MSSIAELLETKKKAPTIQEMLVQKQGSRPQFRTTPQDVRDIQPDRPTTISAKEFSIIDKIKARLYKGRPIRQYDLPTGTRYEPIPPTREQQPLRTMAGMAAYLPAEYLKGRALYTPELLSKDLPEKVTKKIAPAMTLTPKERSFGDALSMYGGLRSAGKIVHPLAQRLPLKELFRLIIGGGGTFGLRNIAEQTPKKLIEGKPIDEGELIAETIMGSMFGAAEGLLVKGIALKRYRDFIKSSPEFKNIPRKILLKVDEAFRAAEKGMSKAALRKTYGKYIKQFADIVKKEFGGEAARTAIQKAAPAFKPPPEQEVMQRYAERIDGRIQQGGTTVKADVQAIIQQGRMELKQALTGPQAPIPAAETMPPMIKPPPIAAEKPPSKPIQPSKPEISPIAAKEGEVKIRTVSPEQLQEIREKFPNQELEHKARGGTVKIKGVDWIFVDNTLSKTAQDELVIHEKRHLEIDQLGTEQLQPVRDIIDYLLENPEADPALAKLVKIAVKLHGKTQAVKEVIAEGLFEVEEAPQDLADLKEGKSILKRAVKRRRVTLGKEKAQPPAAAKEGEVEEEHIVSAAIKVGKRVFTGNSHTEIIREIVKSGELPERFFTEGLLKREDVDLFLTNKGRLVNLEEAKGLKFGKQVAQPPAESAKTIKKMVEEKATLGSVGAMRPGGQDRAIKTAQALAKKSGKNMFVVQGKTGQFTSRLKKPPKGHFTLVTPEGKATFFKQASETAEKAFDYGEEINTKDVMSKLDKFKQKVKEKDANVKVLQLELFSLAKKTIPPSKERASVFALLKSIQAGQQTKTNLKNFMRAVAKTGEAVERYSQKQLKAKIVKELKRTKPKKIHGILKGRLTPETQRRLDYIRRNINKERGSVLEQMAANMERVQKGEMLPVEMLESNSILSLTGTKGASSKELGNMFNGIKTLREQGKLAHDTKIVEIKERRAKVKDRVLYILTGGKGLKEGTSSLPEKAIQKNPSIINRLNRFSSAWDNLMDYMSRFDKTSKQYESDISKLGDLVHIAEVGEATGVEKQMVFLHNAFNEVFGTKTSRQMWRQMNKLQKEDINLGTFTNGLGEKVNWENLSKEEIIKKYMELQDPSLEETFNGVVTEEGKSYGMHWTEEMKDAVKKNLTEQEKAWAEKQLEFYRNYRASINKVYKEQFFMDMGDVFNYSPIGRMVEQEQMTELLLFKEVVRHASTTNPSLKTRVKNVNPLKWMEADKTLINHIARMEHFKAFAKPINELRSIFSDKNVRSAIKQYHGKHVLRRIDLELDQFARGAIDHILVNNWIDKARRNFTVAALARPAIMPKQIPSGLAYMTEMPLKDYVTGIAKFWLRPIKHTRELMQNSPVFKESIRGGHERDVRLVMSKDYGKALAHKRSFRDWLLAHIRLGDYMARGPGQYAKWLYEQKQGKSKDAAMRAAERTTGRTQPGWKLSQLSEPQKGGSLWKLFTMFQTQPIRYYNIAVDNARNAAYGRGSRMKALSNVALIWVVMPVLFNWIADAFQWKPKHQAVAVALGPFAYIPIAGKLIKNIALAMVGEAYGTQLSPVQSVPERFKRAASLLRKLFKDERDPTKDASVDDAIKAVEELVVGLGYGLGYPTPYVVQVERALRNGEPKEFIFSEYALKKEGKKKSKYPKGF